MLLNFALHDLFAQSLSVGGEGGGQNTNNCAHVLEQQIHFFHYDINLIKLSVCVCGRRQKMCCKVKNTYGLYCSFIFLTAEVSICTGFKQELNCVVSTHECSIVQWCLQNKQCIRIKKKVIQYKPTIILTAFWCEYRGQP